MRFKNIPLAQEFRDRFEEAKKFVSENQKSKRNDLNKQSPASTAAGAAVSSSAGHISFSAVLLLH